MLSWLGGRLNGQGAQLRLHQPESHVDQNLFAASFDPRHHPKKPSVLLGRLQMDIKSNFNRLFRSDTSKSQGSFCLGLACKVTRR